jgi:DNA polymerase-4
MTLPEPRDNQVLFLDMNAFFASCEQHLKPELRGKPVVVAPTPGPTGSIIAASYEAKAFGARTFMRVGEAQQHCPGLIVVDSNHVAYKKIHDQIVAFLLTEVSPDTNVRSIDEFAIPLDKREQWSCNAHALALFIKQRLEEIFSPALRCSIGIGPNAFLAKLGTEVQKPNGLVFMQQHTLRDVMGQLKKLTDIPGINVGMNTRLHGLGIHTVQDFFDAPRHLLHAAFGISGDAWWFNLHGYHVTYNPQTMKSMSHSHVLAPKLRTKTKARAVLYKLLIKVVERLRHNEVATQQVFVKVKSLSGRWTKEITLLPTQNAFELFKIFAAAYDKELPSHFEPYQIYIVAFRFRSKQNEQLTLPCLPDNHRVPQLFDSLDIINRKHGRWTLQPASLLPIKESAPNRITFRAPTYDMD